MIFLFGATTWIFNSLELTLQNPSDDPVLRRRLRVFKNRRKK